MIVTLPLPAMITQYFPKALVSTLQWFAFWTFAGLLVVPWLLCIYRLATTSLGRTKSINHILDERAAPKIVVVMPVYKEEPDVRGSRSLFNYLVPMYKDNKLEKEEEEGGKTTTK